MIGWLGERAREPVDDHPAGGRALRARIQTSRGDFRLDAELEAPTGVTALFGPSGSGKTTLLRALAGLETRVEGRIEVATETWLDSAREILLPPHQRAVGYVFQEGNLLPHLTVRGNLEYGRRRSLGAGPGWDDVVEWLELGPLLHRRPDRLSGGEQQRVALARALVRRPRLLLLDEPLSALDEVARRDILPYLERLPARYTVPTLLVTHALDDVIRLANRVVWLDAGRVRAQGTVSEVSATSEFARWRGDDAGVVVDAEVATHHEADHLTELRGPWGPVLVRRQDALAGTPVRLRILARDVSLALEEETTSTILNQFRLRIREVEPFLLGEVLVRMGAGGGPDLLARVTRRSERRLRLRVGKDVFARVKSVALLQEGAGGHSLSVDRARGDPVR